MDGKMSKLKIAIIGHGFVGKAVDYGFNSAVCEKIIIDPNLGSKIEDLLGQDIAASFICVPTPMGNNGEIDSSIVEDCVNYLRDNITGQIIIKSTVIPSVIADLVDSNNGHRIVYNPEFLMEKSANEDFVNPKMHVFGGSFESTKKVEELYNKCSLCKPCPVYHMTAVDASFVKYGINCFLASKVLWFNQFYDVVNNFGGNYGNIINAIGSDSRISPSHTSVPGFDNKRGYGGACFPKDTAAFLNFASDFTVLEEVIKANNEYRKDYTKDSREILQNVSYDTNTVMKGIIYG